MAGISKPPAGSAHEEEGEMTKDPVCKMDIDEKQTNFHSEYAGRKYHFCSEECKDTFDSQPERYAASAA
jgi:YHS domain-containing protein